MGGSGPCPTYTEAAVTGYDGSEEGTMISTLTVDVAEAQGRLRELLDRVAEGSEVILTDRDQPLARISPISSPVGPPREARQVQGSHDPQRERRGGARA